MTVLLENIRVSRTQREAFAYVSDFTTTAEWDATATAARKLTDGPIAQGTRFLVTCALPVGSIDLEYEITEYDPPRQLCLKGSSRWFDIEDRITFTKSGHGTRIEYRAQFTFPRALARLADTFKPGFQRMGKESMRGLKEALEDRYPAPTVPERFRTGVVPAMARVSEFTRLGHRRMERRRKPISAFLQDRHVVVTGASSGLGRAAALELARRGCRLTLVLRDPDKAGDLVAEIERETGNEQVMVELCDLSLLGETAQLVQRLQQRGEVIDVLVNNAGALFNERQLTSEGIEKSLALLLLSPWLLTEGLHPMLVQSDDPRVVNVVSGGMYSQKLDLEKLVNDDPARYSGPVAYARAKRALMVLTEQWAQDWAEEGIAVNAMHPGWADTPGVVSSLPRFHRLTRSVLRSAEEGADTIVWLAAATEAAGVSGQLFMDRAVQPTHLLRGTQETELERQRLQAFLAQGEWQPAGHFDTGIHAARA